MVLALVGVVWEWPMLVVLCLVKLEQLWLALLERVAALVERVVGGVGVVGAIEW